MLTNAADVRALSFEEAARGHPIRLRGVVVYCSQKLPGNFSIQDSTATAFIFSHGRPPQEPVERGQVVEVEGTSCFLTATAGVQLVRVKNLGNAELPAPRRLLYEQLANGNEDSQWVEVRGIVRSISPPKRAGPELLPMDLMMTGGRLLIRVEKYDLAKMQSLIDAEVRIRGMCYYYYNGQHQRFNTRVSVQDMVDIVVEKAAEPVFEGAVSPVNQLMVVRPGGQLGHRVRVQGAVMSRLEEGSFYLRDASKGIQVCTEQVSPALGLGDRVDVYGFADLGEYSPVLHDAIFRRKEPGAPPAAIPVTAESALLRDNDLVKIRGRLLDHVLHPNEIMLVMQTSNSVFNAHLHTGPLDAPLLAEPRNGSDLELTGICEVTVGDLSEYLKMSGTRTPRAFRLRLRSPYDVVVLQAGSWWTRARVLWVLVAVSVICLGGMVWIATLRSRVRTQTEVIRGKIERETVMEERARIARDMHDDLGARLTQIRLFSELSKQQAALPAEAYGRMEQISATARDAVRAMDEIVWSLNPCNDTLPSLLEFLSQYATEYLRLTGMLCRQDFPEEIPAWPVNSGVRHHLLLAFKEVLQNIVKHSGATEIWLRVVIKQDVLTLDVTDNGRGFVPAECLCGTGHDGVENIRARIRQLGGECRVQSSPGTGASITFTLHPQQSRVTPASVPSLGDGGVLKQTL
jgi:signal transduction histidine kinase